MQPRQKLVLIADDDKPLAEAIALRCRSLQLDVELAHDALEALMKIELLSPDLVILDVNMPRGNGLCVADMMASGRLTKATPVIISTGSQENATVRRCHELCAYYVPKCGDSWRRLEPLIRELLPSTDADLPTPLCEESTMLPESVIDHSAGDLGSTTQAASEGIDDRYFDVILQSLGGETDKTDSTADKVDESSDSVPWILCIDDDADFSQLLKTRLEAQGCAVKQAFAGMSGFICAFENPPDAIILDYEMPDGQGDYILQRLRDNPVTHDIPVIVLTGRRDKALERKIYNLGAAEFFTKPIQWEQIWTALQKHMRTRCACQP